MLIVYQSAVKAVMDLAVSHGAPDLASALAEYQSEASQS